MPVPLCRPPHPLRTAPADHSGQLRALRARLSTCLGRRSPQVRRGLFVSSLRVVSKHLSPLLLATWARVTARGTHALSTSQARAERPLQREDGAARLRALRRRDELGGPPGRSLEKGKSRSRAHAAVPQGGLGTPQVQGQLDRQPGMWPQAGLPLSGLEGGAHRGRLLGAGRLRLRLIVEAPLGFHVTLPAAWGPLGIRQAHVAPSLQMQTLQSPRVWLDAATQIFFSLSLAFGGHIAFASYNPPRNDCRKDAVTVALVNSMTSLYASIAIFSVLGFKATNDYGQCLDRNIVCLTNAFELPDQSLSRDDYAAALAHLNATQPHRVAALPLASCRLQDFLDKGVSGPGLAFVVLAEAVLHLPGSAAWSVLLFAMLLALGLSSMFGNMEGVITPLLDMGVVPRSVPKEAFTGLACLGCFLLATCFTLRSGLYLLEVFDSHVAALSLILLAFLEVTGVVFVYGLRRFCDDVAWMTGRRPSLYWQGTWRVASPLLLLTIFVAYIGMLAWKAPSYRAWDPQYAQFPGRQEKLYPGWVQVVSALLAVVPALGVLAVALARLLAWRRRRGQDGAR
ncbi:inactive sodium-dependent neutral amino acid transporter B(0)AT3 [Dasypus novemcinctus]|uniref:inactive sodium-dependent neutral amino acid transporter B(0)AT3 n=1 Tax=Dasypus novemcinctus TaxID=9361 RepID=UPI00265F0744|nr:inactive sodium-dependent neutral amino acid transporter B(0)AT3 [Dasypus novemcinctus]